MSNVIFCAKCVSLDQRYYTATRQAYAPESTPIQRVAAQATRVSVRKAMVSHLALRNH